MAELVLKIEDVRVRLQDLLSQTDDPLDPHVIYISKILDKLLTNYYTMNTNK